MDLGFCFLCFAFVSCATLLSFFLVSLVKTSRNTHFGNNKMKLYNLSDNMSIVENLMERLRQLVGSKGWDYCVLWKLSDDQRFVEWMDCCCAGIEMINNKNINGGEELHHFPVSPLLPCRDVIIQHPRTKSCELLSQLPSSIPLDSGINHAQTLISNHPSWINFPYSSEADVTEAIWTRVLIPVVGGLIELLATKEVSEDQHVIDFITAQCSISMDQEAMINTSNMDASLSSSINDVHAMNDLQKPLLADGNNNLHSLQPPVSTAFENSDHMPYDISVDRIRLRDSSPMNFLQQFNYSTNSENKTRNDDVFFEGSHDHHSFLSPKTMNSFHSSSENGIHQEMDAHNALTNAATNTHMQFMENNLANEDQLQGNEKESNKQQNGRSDSVSDCSDQIDDEDDAKYRRRTGKGPQAKNLEAERRRRKKLNNRLYALRALVPKISKLDRASILGDAIEFVKELQNQAKELQYELEEHSDDEGANNNGGMNGNHNIVKPEISGQSGMVPGPKTEHDKASNGFHVGAASGNNGSVPKQNQDLEISNDKTQQMEPQVEVAQLDGNEFFIKVFCEHKPGGFVRLMEALNSLGLEVTNANVTSFLGLVSNVFKVEKRDSEMVQADHVRDSLLELTRNPSRGWPHEMGKASESINGMEYNHHLHNHHISSHHHHHQLHHLHN